MGINRTNETQNAALAFYAFWLVNDPSNLNPVLSLAAEEIDNAHVASKNGNSDMMFYIMR